MQVYFLYIRESVLSKEVKTSGVYTTRRSLGKSWALKEGLMAPTILEGLCAYVDRVIHIPADTPWNEDLVAGTSVKKAGVGVTHL